MDILLLLIGMLGIPVSVIFIVIKLVKKQFNKKMLMLPVICLIVMIIGLAMPSGKPSDTETDGTISADSDEQKKIELSTYESVDSYLAALKDASPDVETGTSAMVDLIGFAAMDDAKNVSAELLTEAIEYISSEYPNYYDSNEKMEKVMYYGYLLDYASEENSPEDKLGIDAYQVVKYVYRGADISDTDENLKQIKDDLEALK